MRPLVNYCIKVLAVSGLFIILSQPLLAQEISYTYDDNGNRVNRSILLRKSGSMNDTVSEDKSQREVFKEEIGETQVRIYPNPTRGDLTVEISGLPLEAQVESGIYSSSGVMVKKQKLSRHKFQIDFNIYPAGIYVLKLSIAGEVSEWKIIKE